MPLSQSAIRIPVFITNLIPKVILSTTLVYSGAIKNAYYLTLDKYSADDGALSRALLFRQRLSPSRAVIFFKEKIGKVVTEKGFFALFNIDKAVQGYSLKIKEIS